MKFNPILLICIATAAAEPLRPEYSCQMLKCKELDVTQADIEDYVYLRRAASDKAKCFRACIFRECKVINPDGRLVSNVIQISGFLTSRRDPSLWAITEEAARRCMAILPAVQKNICETTEAFMRCVPAKSPVKLTIVGAYCEQYEGGDDVICQ